MWVIHHPRLKAKHHNRYHADQPPRPETPASGRRRIATIAGVALLAVAAAWYAGELWVLHRAVTITAVIEQIHRGAPIDDDTGHRYYPTDARVRFQAEGRLVRATVPLGGACGSGRCPYRQGDAITIAYDSRRPTSAELARRSPSQVWLMVPLAAVGVALLGVGVTGRLLGKI
jgi:hypothetical protein